jgi:hypothetical protein
LRSISLCGQPEFKSGPGNGKKAHSSAADAKFCDLKIVAKSMAARFFHSGTQVAWAVGIASQNCDQPALFHTTRHEIHRVFLPDKVP